MSNASTEEEGNLLHKVKNFYSKGSSKSSPQVVAALFPILFFLSCTSTQCEIENEAL